MVLEKLKVQIGDGETDQRVTPARHDSFSSSAGGSRGVGGITGAKELPGGQWKISFCRFSFYMLQNHGPKKVSLFSESQIASE